MGIDYYYFLGSPPCAALEFAAKNLGVTLNPIEKDFFKKEHLTPEFGKLNPQRTCPVISDNGYVLAESRPIIIYLQEKYGKDESLYPNDPQKRGIINHRMYYEMGTLYQRMGDVMEGVFGDKTEIKDSERKKVDDAVEVVELYLTCSKWIAGDNITLADFSFTVTLDILQACGYDYSSKNKIAAYLKNAKATFKDYDETAGRHIKFISAYIRKEAEKKGLKLFN